MEDLKDILEWIQLDEENKLIVEFANIGPKTHKFGVEIIFHVMQPGEQKLKHGPRAKFMLRGTNSEFCISINDHPRVIGKWKDLVTEKELNVLLKNIKKFKIPLLNFWYDSKMSTDELYDEMELVRADKYVLPTHLDQIDKKKNKRLN